MQCRVPSSSLTDSCTFAPPLEMRHVDLAHPTFIVYRRFTMKINLSEEADTGITGYSSTGDAGVAARLAALSHPARLAIVRRLAAADACCCKDVVRHLDLAQSTVSQHLKVLVQAGLVIYEPTRPRSR